MKNGDASVPNILLNMSETFKERGKIYKDTYNLVPNIIKALWPEGVPCDLVSSPQWHLFELIIVKLTRFATSQLTHIDSIHDTAIYSAMIESILTRKEID